jgi:hypothetical protein
MFVRRYDTRPEAHFPLRHPRNRARVDRAGQPASTRARRPLRRMRPQRDAAVAARAARPRFRRRADSAGRRATRLGGRGMRSVPCLRCATCFSFHSKHVIVSHGQPLHTAARMSAPSNSPLGAGRTMES